MADAGLFEGRRVDLIHSGRFRLPGELGPRREAPELCATDHRRVIEALMRALGASRDEASR